MTIDLVGLRKAYDKACKDARTDFIFGGMPWLTQFTKYFLEYYEKEYNINGTRIAHNNKSRKRT